MFIIAALFSASFHVVVFFGIGRRHHVAHVVVEEKPNVIRITMPDMKDLEDPEPLLTDEPPPPDPGVYAPTLMDVPNRIALPNDFVQKIDFSSLIPPPDLNGAKIFVIPEHIGHGKLAESIGSIFNLADLDRVPEAVVQPSPVFPPALKREVDTARVRVEFIVDREGRVLEPVVMESTNSGFNEAALSGVSRWRFRPGMKGGRKVNTRMSVPINFIVVPGDP